MPWAAELDPKTQLPPSESATAAPPMPSTAYFGMLMKYPG